MEQHAQDDFELHRPIVFKLPVGHSFTVRRHAGEKLRTVVGGHSANSLFASRDHDSRWS
jgi:hypothetical protein